jgi:hypothetical protein
MRIRIGQAALGAAVALLMAGSAQAQNFTADQLVAKNLEARGGADKLAAIKSVRFNGKLIFPGGFELAYVETRARGQGVRQNATIQGMTVIQAYDGRQAWRINPFQGRRDPDVMSPDETRQMADSGSIEGALLANQADKGTVAYQGIEDVDGTPAYKLKVTQRDGDEFTYFLDPDTFLEIKVVEARRIRGAEQVTESDIGDYEKVAGVYFPMAITSGPQGGGPNQQQTITVDTAEANVSVEPNYFNMPATPAASATPK